jgi:predicted dehydrogenase
MAVADPREDCRLEAVHVWQHGGGLTPRTGTRTYEEGAQVCRDPDVDLVWILAPPYLHYPLARLALEQGKAVFLEKPGALRPAQMAELASLAEQAGLPASVDFVMRRTPLARLVARIVRSGVLGPVERSVLENVAHDERLPEGHWFWNPALSGGIFVEHGVHFFDMATWWFGEGEVRHALALRRTRWKDAPVDRVLCTCLHGIPASPVIATYYHSFTTVERFERACWHLVLHRGFLDVEGWIPTVLRGEVLVTESEARWLEQCLGCTLQPLEPPQPHRDPPWAGEDAGAGCATGQGATERGGAMRYRARLALEYADRTMIYRDAIRAGLEDLATCMLEQGGSRPAVTLDDARRALELAAAATELATSS